MKTKETSTREQALAYWKPLPSDQKLKLWREYQKTTFTPSHSPDELTDREIEEIWKKENPIATLPDELINIDFDGIEEEHAIKPNQKQLPEWCKQPESCNNSLSGKCICPKPNTKVFKQFDESLFKAYIDKFSDEDKAIEVLAKNLKDSNLKWYILKWFSIE